MKLPLRQPTEVDDLSPLDGMPLKTLLIDNTKVHDLFPLAEMRLEEHYINGSPVVRLEPLRKHPLNKIGLDNPAPHTALLSTMPTLTHINGRPVSEILGQREP